MAPDQLARASGPASSRSVAELRSAQNLPLAVIAGIAAAVIGACLWAAATVMTHMQLGIVAVGIGLFIGYAIRETGKGIDDSFRYLGAGCALFGCALGTVLSDLAFLAEYKGMPVTDVFRSASVPLLQKLVPAFFHPMDLLFYAIAIYEAYKVSRKWRVRTR